MARAKKSVVTGDRESECFMCKSEEPCEVHHIYKGKNRKISDENGFYVHLCPSCHRYLHGKDGHMMDVYLMKTCQLDFEKNHSRDDFMKLIGCNYIIEEDEE